MKNVILSILIPAYNAESTIRRCIKSLVDDSRKNYEIIVVDDGSTDETLDILKEIEKNNECLRVVHQENRGVAATRQKLIELAIGEYVMFCDADDYLETKAIEQLFCILCDGTLDIDTIVFGYNILKENTVKSIRLNHLSTGAYVKVEFEKFHVEGLTNLYWSALWNKCYRKDKLFCPSKVIFKELIEDVIFNAEVLPRCRKIAVVDLILYNYVQIGDSLTRGIKKDTHEAIQKAFETYKLLVYILRENYPNEKNAIDKYAYNMIKNTLQRAKKISDTALVIMIKRDSEYVRVIKELGIKKWILDIDRLKSICKILAKKFKK